jgi:predicted kinase
LKTEGQHDENHQTESFVGCTISRPSLRPRATNEFYEALASFESRIQTPELRDAAMQPMLDLKKCYPAYVRGKVETMRGLAKEAPPVEQEMHFEEARRYFRLALQYAVAGSKPLVLVVMGRIASGKSTLARALVAELGWDLFSSDRLRKQTAGVPLYERGSEDARAQLYSTATTEKTYQNLFAAVEAEVGAGRSVMLEASFGRRSHRDQLRKRLSGCGVRCRVVKQAEMMIKERLQARQTRSNVVPMHGSKI